MKTSLLLLSALVGLFATAVPARATIDDALSFALEAADPYVKEGFTVREDYWGGDLPVKQTKAIVHQLNMAADPAAAYEALNFYQLGQMGWKDATRFV